jgi:oligoendopeptidase F
MATAATLPRRSEVPADDTWDLSALFNEDAGWEHAFKKLEGQLGGFAAYRGRLGTSDKVLRECLDFDAAFDREMDKLSSYAHLKMTEDMANSVYVGLVGRVTDLSSKAMQAASFIRPELLALPKNTLEAYLNSKELVQFRFQLEKTIRQKPHVLSEPEEKLLALQVPAGQGPSKIFDQLNNSDMDFGTIDDADGKPVKLTHGSFRNLLESQDRAVRERAFRQYYSIYTAHQNTLATTLAGSVQQDIFEARARHHKSCLDAALFTDNVPRSVYENLIATVRAHLGPVYEYLDLRQRTLKLPDLHIYDTYVPILSDLKVRHTFGEASRVILEALAPLGTDYTQALALGLASRWVDRYENQGKRSGAFSSGGYDSPPYILMNFKEDVLDDVFTLAHEAGHSMHSYYSARAQAYPTWSYTIFVAEVASTFNEQLLSAHLLKNATDDRARAFLLNREIDAIRGTLVRQTMFADFELKIHDLVEAGESLTLDRLRSEYRQLLTTYFGPRFTLDTELELEGLRIPHFYRAFYVYKYATGISAAIALADRVTSGGAKELADYLGFLKAGGSAFPLDILKAAGVDMTGPAPIEVAMKLLGQRVRELAQLIR